MILAVDVIGKIHRKNTSVVWWLTICEKQNMLRSWFKVLAETDTHRSFPSGFLGDCY